MDEEILLNEIVFKDSNYIIFNVLGDEIGMIFDQTDYGRNTIAEVNGIFYYLGDEPPNLESAMFVWQDIYDRDLSVEELDKVLSDNNIALDAIDGE